MFTFIALLVSGFVAELATLLGMRWYIDEESTRTLARISSLVAVVKEFKLPAQCPPDEEDIKPPALHEICFHPDPKVALSRLRKRYFLKRKRKEFELVETDG